MAIEIEGDPVLSVSSDAEEETQETEVEDSGQPELEETEPAIDAEEPKEGGMQRRFKEYAQRVRAKDEQIAALTQTVQTLISNQSKVPKVEAVKPPVPDDFEDPNQYLEAKVAHEVQSRLEQYQQQVQQRTYQVQQQTRLAQKMQEARSKYSDFDEVVINTPATDSMAMAIAAAEKGTDIAYYLGKNRDVAQRICGLDPVAQIVELGKLEALLESSSSRHKTSSATKPISPLKGRSSTVVDLNSMSMDDYANARNTAEIAARKAARKR